jgi:acyl-CoA thioesterase
VSQNEHHREMDAVAELSTLLAAQPKAACASLTSFEVVAADLGAGLVRLRFAEQPAFSNHYGSIQGGLGMALIDVLASVAAYAKLRQWCPTVEMKAMFVAPAKLGQCEGEARVIKVGKTFAFLEARLWGADGELAIHATATVSVKA